MTVIDWLLDSDPAIRWQVMRELNRASEGEVAAERARVAIEGFGARLLALQADDGRWGGGVAEPPGRVGGGEETRNRKGHCAGRPDGAAVAEGG